jgi:hypothetical protein
VETVCQTAFLVAVWMRQYRIHCSLSGTCLIVASQFCPALLKKLAFS